MKLKPKIEAAVAKLQSPILKEREQAKADIDRVTKQLELSGAAALKPDRGYCLWVRAACFQHANA